MCVLGNILFIPQGHHYCQQGLQTYGTTEMLEVKRWVLSSVLHSALWAIFKASFYFALIYYFKLWITNKR